MRPWAKWLIKHRMGWAVFGVLIAYLPVYLSVGVWKGCSELLNDWVADWKRIKLTTQKGVK